ncbi:MAG TPA: response regulator transcription factor [Candidatus Limnocylindrales bacterium]|nr:response regulator transcription factor [Candidatus Limnocylindrales bacterium]
MSYRIYLVEDEPNLNRLLASYLQKEGWAVTSMHTGEEARQAMVDQPHLWILDIMLPDIDGYQLIGEIKQMSPLVPVIFISARDADLDRVIGLEKGSDDYLPKPFLPRELIIRVGKLLERVYNSPSGRDGGGHVYPLPPYLIDEPKRIVMEKGHKIELTSREFDLLLCLVRHLDSALSREQVITIVWGSDYFGSDRVVDDMMRRLRKKMPALNVETIYGYGYRLVKR